MNNNLVLISGKSATGKSVSLRNIKNPEGVMYLNCENNKALPFPAKFQKYTVTDPMQIYEAFTVAETQPNIHTIVIDTLTFLMNMYETQYVKTSTNTMKAWGEYGDYFINLMQQYVAKSTKRIVFLAHTADVFNETEMVSEVLVKVKGALMNQGVEAYFSTVISSKKMKVKDLEEYENPLLVITPQEKAIGYKYVFQTQLTSKTVNERIRGSIGMWSVEETFIDNDVQLVLDRLEQYYGN